MNAKIIFLNKLQIKIFTKLELLSLILKTMQKDVSSI